jgi:hypothetical protein
LLELNKKLISIIIVSLLIGIGIGAVLTHTFFKDKETVIEIVHECPTGYYWSYYYETCKVIVPDTVYEFSYFIPDLAKYNITDCPIRASTIIDEQAESIMSAGNGFENCIVFGVIVTRDDEVIWDLGGRLTKYALLDFAEVTLWEYNVTAIEGTDAIRNRTRINDTTTIGNEFSNGESIDFVFIIRINEELGHYQGNPPLVFYANLYLLDDFGYSDVIAEISYIVYG